MPLPVPDTPFVHTLERIHQSAGRRWRNADGSRLYEWDSLHGHFEGYDKRGNHVGVFDEDGRFVGKAIAGRGIDV
jgi:hypothetical protein